MIAAPHRPTLVPLLSAAEMQAWDLAAREEFGVAESTLMESAGRAAADVIEHLYPEGRIVVAVGKGNNGGDGLIAARTMHARGRDVRIIPAADGALRGDLLHGWDVPVERGDAAAAFATAAVSVDAILGTGVTGAPREPQALLIRALNAAGRPVVALDGPSGVDLTTGQVAGDAVHARATVTFGAPKRGHLLFPGRLHAGRLLAVEIGFPPLQSDAASAEIVTDAWAAERLPPLPANAHKGTMGTVLVVAGRTGTAGAAAMAGTAALRAGAGLLVLASTSDNREILQAAVPEALFVNREGDAFSERAKAADAVVVGPGMGTDDGAALVLRTVLASGEAQLLLDADALTMLARDPSLRDAAADRPLLLTPHPGEMGRLLDVSTGEVVADPFGHAAAAAERFRCAVLLKGSPSLVASPDGRTRVSVAGHAGLATGGTGDTLAGITGAMLAAGADPADAGALAMTLGGKAAEVAGLGRGLLPRDVARALPEAIARLHDAGRLALPVLRLDLPA